MCAQWLRGFCAFFFSCLQLQILLRSPQHDFEVEITKNTVNKTKIVFELSAWFEVIIVHCLSLVQRNLSHQDLTVHNLCGL